MCECEGGWSEAYRRQTSVFVLAVSSEQVSHHRDGPLPPALDVPVHAAARHAASVGEDGVIAAAGRQQRRLGRPVLVVELRPLLGDGRLPGQQLPVVGDGPRSGAAASSSGPDGGAL